MAAGSQNSSHSPDEPGEFASRIVVCPHCKGDSVYHSSNSARPFCSPRCRALDLGAWANEDFRVADGIPVGDTRIDDV
ncbi:MAG: DNA gyrase inhibitor YacG [Burkholderiales bacterium PBB3]|nr:MAG: DNA gyrase inhibitor YacG [Burkholderiales bacterium PBB3]